jgi:hypothetical protein
MGSRGDSQLNKNGEKPLVRSREGFQFSTRDLLIATTVISAAPAIGMPFGGFALVAAVIGLIQAIILLAGDWLIRPENRRALAFATAVSWATLGSGLLVLAIQALVEASDSPREASGMWMLEGSLAVGAAASYLMALFRWRKIAAQGRENLKT